MKKNCEQFFGPKSRKNRFRRNSPRHADRVGASSGRFWWKRFFWKKQFFFDKSERCPVSPHVRCKPVAPAPHGRIHIQEVASETLKFVSWTLLDNLSEQLSKTGLLWRLVWRRFRMLGFFVSRFQAASTRKRCGSMYFLWNTASQHRAAAAAWGSEKAPRH